MSASETSEPEVQFSVARVARMMGVSREAVRDAVRRKRLRAEVILVGDQIGVSIPLSAVADFWNLSQASVNRIDTDARTGIRKAMVAIVTPLILEQAGPRERSATPVTNA